MAPNEIRIHKILDKDTVRWHITGWQNGRKVKQKVVTSKGVGVPVELLSYLEEVSLQELTIKETKHPKPNYS